MENTEEFCQLVRQRTQENKKAIELLSENRLTGQVISILRQELDSMVRVIYLLSHPIEERNHMINLTLTGQKWRLRNRGQVTDRLMVDLADSLNGWTNSVYKFGCAFIHLSDFHNYLINDPFKNLNSEETHSIKRHLNHYHGFPLETELTLQSTVEYLVPVFNKISSNLKCYISNLEKEEESEIMDL